MSDMENSSNSWSSKKITVRLPIELSDKLDNRSAKECLTKSEIVVEALRQYLSDSQRHVRYEEMVEYVDETYSKKGTLDEAARH